VRPPESHSFWFTHPSPGSGVPKEAVGKRKGCDSGGPTRAGGCVRVGALAAPLMLLAQGGEAGQRDLGAEVARLLAAKCAKCHTPDSDEVKAKRLFDSALDLERAKSELVEPGELELSDLWLQVEDGSMPPADSGVAPPDAAELDALRAWILSGAPLAAQPPGDGARAQDPAPERAAPGRAAANPARPAFSRAVRLIGRLHPPSVHFPIALVVAALLAEVLGGRARRLAGASRFCILVAAACAPFVAALGWIHAAVEGRTGSTLDLHRWLGVATALGTLVLAWLSERRFRGAAPGADRAFRVALVACAVLVGIAAHFGGTLVYGEGYWSF